MQLLDNGLTFSPTPNTPTKDLHSLILHNFNIFSRSLRLKYTKQRYTKQKHKQKQKHNTLQPTTTSFLYRRMNFLPLLNPETYVSQYSGFSTLENYIDNAKQRIADNLQQFCQTTNCNLTKQQQQSLKKFQQARQAVTIKPADKNLGIILVNTDDYISQCLIHLTDTEAYRLIQHYPSEHITKQLSHILSAFKSQLESHDKRLYKYLDYESRQTTLAHHVSTAYQKCTKTSHIFPQFALSPHNLLPLLSPTGQFNDHVLVPVARFYPDYLHNSTELLLILQDLHVPDDVVLVTVDVTSLYPSIPQAQCLNIIYEELHTHRHLLTFDPNLVIQMLHVNINNYFTLNNFTLQQVKGTAMGVPFFPTISYVHHALRFFKNTTNSPTTN